MPVLFNNALNHVLISESGVPLTEKTHIWSLSGVHDWCNKGRGMCYPVCGTVHIKEPLLLIDKSSLCGAAGFLSHYQNGP